MVIRLDQHCRSTFDNSRYSRLKFLRIQRKFQRHAKSVFVSKCQLSTSLSTFTADRQNTSTLLTTWEIIEGLCHDCLGYPLYFSPPDGLESSSHGVNAKPPLALSLPYSNSLIKKINFLSHFLFDTCSALVTGAASCFCQNLRDHFPRAHCMAAQCIMIKRKFPYSCCKRGLKR